jgi:hypothetical protein
MAGDARFLVPTEEAREDAPVELPFATFDDFLPFDDAAAMRAAAEAHFQDPYRHKPESHHVWNYWYVPGIYTYLRAVPERVLGRDLVVAFHDRLRRWAVERLGLGSVTWPMLSLYVDGCGQGIHNDSTNGRFGYVFSLTRNDRNSRGGETIVWKEGDPFRANLNRANAGAGLYDLVPPVFNRLVLFDDRMPHGVQRIEGSMDPLDGRLVLHGHISEGDALIQGPLTPQTVQSLLLPALDRAFDAFPDTEKLHHGPLTLRLEIGPDGRVAACRILVNRVARSDGGSAAPFVESIVGTIKSLRFPPGGAPTLVIFPILTGGVLPMIRQQMEQQREQQQGSPVRF